MNVFWQRILTRMLLTAALSGLILYVGADLAEKQIPLMPQSESGIPWVGSTQPPATTDTTLASPAVTRTTVLEEDETIRYEIFLSSQQQYPYGSYDFTFLSEANERRLVDLRRPDRALHAVPFDTRQELLKPEDALHFARAADRDRKFARDLRMRIDVIRLKVDTIEPDEALLRRDP